MQAARVEGRVIENINYALQNPKDKWTLRKAQEEAFARMVLGLRELYNVKKVMALYSFAHAACVRGQSMWRYEITFHV